MGTFMVKVALFSATFTIGRVTQSPDVCISEGSEDSRGTKRKRYTKNLFGVSLALGSTRVFRAFRNADIRALGDTANSCVAESLLGHANRTWRRTKLLSP
jgi:hypothetical protein